MYGLLALLVHWVVVSAEGYTGLKNDVAIVQGVQPPKMILAGGGGGEDEEEKS